jgi:integrase
MNSALTGARRGNVLAMRWEDINLERETWTIPETKTGDKHHEMGISKSNQIFLDRK